MKENDKSEEAEHIAVKESSDSAPQRTGLHDCNQRRNAVLHKARYWLSYPESLTMHIYLQVSLAIASTCLHPGVSSGIWNGQSKNKCS